MMIETHSISDFGDQDYARFVRNVKRRTGILLEDYKPEQMRRRIATMAQNAGTSSYDGYFGVLTRGGPALTTFLDQLTINVSELFRNPAQFDDLQRKILPSLLAPDGTERNRPVRIWSAGCSHGAEAYSLAVVMHDLKHGANARILATDLDTAILDKARAGHYTRTDMQNVTPERRAAYFDAQGDGYRVKDSLKAHVTFDRHDLLADPYPAATFDLIACRNVVIYFTDAAKARVYQSFLNALKPGGVLFIGGTERIADHRALGFEFVLPYFYRRPLAERAAPKPGGNGTDGGKTEIR